MRKTPCEPRSPQRSRPQKVRWATTARREPISDPSARARHRCMHPTAGALSPRPGRNAALRPGLRIVMMLHRVRRTSRNRTRCDAPFARMVGEGYPSLAFAGPHGDSEDAASVEESSAPARPRQSGRSVRPFVEARNASASPIYFMTWCITRLCGSVVRSVGGPNRSASVGAFLCQCSRRGEMDNR